MCCHRVLEELLELHLLGYPPSMLRALSHSLPLSPATQALRAVIRVWGRTRSAAMGVPKAERIMEKHTLRSRKWQDDEAQAANAAELQAQGEALAAVMAHQFK